MRGDLIFSRFLSNRLPISCMLFPFIFFGNNESKSSRRIRLTNSWDGVFNGIECHANEYEAPIYECVLCSSSFSNKLPKILVSKLWRQRREVKHVMKISQSSFRYTIRWNYFDDVDITILNTAFLDALDKR